MNGASRQRKWKTPAALHDMLRTLPDSGGSALTPDRVVRLRTANGEVLCAFEANAEMLAFRAVRLGDPIGAVEDFRIIPTEDGPTLIVSVRELEACAAGEAPGVPNRRLVSMEPLKRRGDDSGPN